MCVHIATCNVGNIFGLLVVRESRGTTLSRVNKIYSHLLVADFLVVLGFLPLGKQRRR